MSVASPTRTNFCDPQSLADVTQACGCDEQQASELLRRADHKPKKAIKLYRLHSRYREKASPKPSPAMTPITPQSEDGISPNDQHVGIGATSKPLANESTNEKTAAVNNRSLPSGQSLPHRADEETSAEGKMANADIADVEKEQPEWDLLLPVVVPSLSLKPNPAEEYEEFNLREAIAWMQYGASFKDIQQYCGRFDDSTIRNQVNNEILGFPAMFYVVETNKEDILRLWHSYGGDVSAIHESSKMPLLAFAIIHSEKIQSDTTLMTATLLSLGASPHLIPTAFYSPYSQDLPDSGPNSEGLKELTNNQNKWCTDLVRVKLARTCTLSQRYYLERAAKTKPASKRQQQVARRMRAEPLLGISNFLIGQTTAAKSLLDTLLAHLTVSGEKPLVLVFAGPSGHGKTELARRLGHLMSLELEVVDCSIFNHEMELFGPRHPYVGADKGTPLNNFLAKHDGGRSIVFLDEFEKTGPAIHKTLLLPFENGEYQDRRSLDKIDCSKTIWILATNAHDPIIQDFSAANNRVLFSGDDEAEVQRLLKQLSHRIREDFRAHHGAPITGRVSDFLPFLAFSPGEQAVIVHKALLELGRKVREPVNLTEGPEEKLLGNIRMRIRRDASVCRSLAETEYHTDLGARSLIAAAAKIKRLLVEEYLKVDQEITEQDGMSEFIIDINSGEIVVNMVPPKVG